MIYDYSSIGWLARHRRRSRCPKDPPPLPAHPLAVSSASSQPASSTSSARRLRADAIASVYGSADSDETPINTHFLFLLMRIRRRLLEPGYKFTVTYGVFALSYPAVRGPAALGAPIHWCGSHGMPTSLKMNKATARRPSYPRRCAFPLRIHPRSRFRHAYTRESRRCSLPERTSTSSCAMAIRASTRRSRVRTSPCESLTTRLLPTMMTL